jgi:putative methionine-R-sulfoxide reductase with GAF domain
MVVVPLFHAGNAIGVLKILSNLPNVFQEIDVKTLKAMSIFLGSALAKQLHQEIMNFI